MTNNADDDPYKFGFVSGWLQHVADYEARLDTASIPTLKATSAVYKENMMRVRNLGALVPEMAFWSRGYARIAAATEYSLGRVVGPPRRIRGAAPPDQEFIDEFKSQWEKWEKPPSGDAWQDGCDLVKGLVANTPEFHGEGLRALMSALLLETWSAFEGILVDTWVAALNHSAELADNALGNEKTLPISMLAKYGYDVSNSLGTLISEIPGKVDLGSLSGIRKAYSSAFKYADSEEIFSRYDPHIQHFEAIRHILAHKAGRVDDRFLRRVVKSDTLSRFTVGQRLEIDGQMVAFYTNCSVSCAVEMHMFVDSLLADDDLGQK